MCAAAGRVQRGVAALPDSAAGWRRVSPAQHGAERTRHDLQSAVRGADGAGRPAAGAVCAVAGGRSVRRHSGAGTAPDPAGFSRNHQGRADPVDSQFWLELRLCAVSVPGGDRFLRLLACFPPPHAVALSDAARAGRSVVADPAESQCRERRCRLYDVADAAARSPQPRRLDLGGRAAHLKGSGLPACRDRAVCRAHDCSLVFDARDVSRKDRRRPRLLRIP